MDDEASSPAEQASRLPRLRPLLIIVDDDAADRVLMGEALADSGFDAELMAFPRGDDLLALLAEPSDRLIEAVAAQRCLVLLDLNMPGMSGLDVLTRLKSDATTDAISVVMFTTSSSPNDRRRCLDLGASAFLVKPSSYGDLVTTFASLPRFFTAMLAGD